MKKVTKLLGLAAIAGGAYYLFKKNRDANTEYETDEANDTEPEELEFAPASEEDADSEAVDDAVSAFEGIGDEEVTASETALTREQKLANIREKASVVAKKAYGRSKEIGVVVADNANKAAKVIVEKASSAKDIISEKLAEKNSEALEASDPADEVDEALEEFKAESDEIIIPIEDDIAAPETLEPAADEADPE